MRGDLVGKRVLVTRPTAQASEFVAWLEQQGAIPISLAAIEIAPIQDGSLAEVLERIEEYDWIVFTSVNGAAAVAQHIGSIPARVRIASIGPATADAVSSYFRAPDVVPEEYVSDALPSVMGDVSGKKVLLARADIARKELAVELRARGAVVTEVAAYHIIGAVPTPALRLKPDYITVTSSSSALATAKNFERLGHPEWASVPWICIGPVTAKTVKEMGFEVGAVANEYTIEGLKKALLGVAELVQSSQGLGAKI